MKKAPKAQNTVTKALDTSYMLRKYLSLQKHVYCQEKR